MPPTRTYPALAPLAATPRPGFGAAASSPTWAVPARRRTAAITTDRNALPSKVRVWETVLRYCTTGSWSSTSSSSSSGHRCARDKPTARAEGPESVSEAVKHTRSVACCSGVLLVVTAMSEYASRGNKDTYAWVKRERRYLARVSHDNAGFIQTEAYEGRRLTNL
jgi:hypothetical protein